MERLFRVGFFLAYPSIGLFRDIPFVLIQGELAVLLSYRVGYDVDRPEVPTPLDIQHFTHPEVLPHQIAHTRDDLQLQNRLRELASNS